MGWVKITWKTEEKLASLKERGLRTPWHLFTQHKETQPENCFFFVGRLCRALKPEKLLRSPRLPCVIAAPLLPPPAWRPVPPWQVPVEEVGTGTVCLLFPLPSPCLPKPVAELTWEKASISYSSEAGAPTGTWAGSQRVWGSVGWQWQSAVELPGRPQEQLPYVWDEIQAGGYLMCTVPAADCFLVLRLLLGADTHHCGWQGGFHDPSRLSSLGTRQCRCGGTELGGELTLQGLACSSGMPQQHSLLAGKAGCLLPLPVAG